MLFSMAAEAICHVTSSIPQKVVLIGMASDQQVNKLIHG
jgi:hypothetical protein